MRRRPTPPPRALSAGLALALALAAAPTGAAEKPAVRKAVPAKAAAAPQGKKARVRKAEAPRLPFVEGDYEQALADAKARNVPLVVDVWAPW